MRQLIDNLSSMSWWLSVALASIAFNVLSTYLVRRLDSHLSRTSSWWSKRSQHKQAQRDKIISELKSNSETRMLFAFTAIRTQVYSVMLYLVAATVGLGGNLLWIERKLGASSRHRWQELACSATAFLFLFTAAAIFRRAREQEDILREALSRES